MPRCPTTPVNGVAGHHSGGAEGIRTPDLLIANETRYQLRHSPWCTLRMRDETLAAGRPAPESP
jgi:hypothetical protein